MLMLLLRQTRGTPFLACTVVTKSPTNIADSNRSEVADDAEPFTICFQGTAGVSFTHWLSGCHEQEPTRPDDLNRRAIDKIRIVFATILGFASLIAVFPRANAQMIVPADRTLRPPDGLISAGFGVHYFGSCDSGDDSTASFF